LCPFTKRTISSSSGSTRLSHLDGSRPYNGIMAVVRTMGELQKKWKREKVVDVVVDVDVDEVVTKA